MRKICWSPVLHAGPRWGSLQHSPRLPIWWGGAPRGLCYPPPQEPHLQYCHCACPVCSMYTRVWKCTVIFSWMLNAGPHSCLGGGLQLSSRGTARLVFVYCPKVRLSIFPRRLTTLNLSMCCHSGQPNCLAFIYICLFVYLHLFIRYFQLRDIRRQVYTDCWCLVAGRCTGSHVTWMTTAIMCAAMSLHTRFCCSGDQNNSSV